MVYGYVLILLVATPYLPLLIRWASFRWSGGSVNRFVLGVEVSMGILLLVLAGGIFFYNRRRFLRFLLIAGGSILAVSLFYRIIPNPYELTHLPEYGILSILTMQAFEGAGGSSTYSTRTSDRSEPEPKLSKTVIALFPFWVRRTGTYYSNAVRVRRTEGGGANSLYFRSAVLTTAIGAMDELYQGLLPTRYFIWYDILLNGLGGVLGLVIVWGVSRD